MQLLIIGANGGIGSHCVEQALEAGHHVTAIVRNPGKAAAKAFEPAISCGVM